MLGLNDSKSLQIIRWVNLCPAAVGIRNILASPDQSDHILVEWKQCRYGSAIFYNKSVDLDQNLSCLQWNCVQFNRIMVKISFSSLIVCFHVWNRVLQKNCAKLWRRQITVLIKIEKFT